MSDTGGSETTVSVLAVGAPHELGRVGMGGALLSPGARSGFSGRYTGGGG